MPIAGALFGAMKTKVVFRASTVKFFIILVIHLLSTQVLLPLS